MHNCGTYSTLPDRLAYQKENSFYLRSVMILRFNRYRGRDGTSAISHVASSKFRKGDFMKRKISITAIGLWVLGAGLLASLIVNCVQYCLANPAAPILLQGAYSTDSAGINGRYLTFDKDGYFYLYSQSDGILEEGSCTESAENLYELDSTSGNHSSVLLTEDGVYYASADGTLELFSRFSDVPAFIGDWVKDWDHRPEGTCEVEEG